MIRFASPSVAEAVRDDGKVPTFDRSRYGMIGPAAGLVIYDLSEIEARLKATAETASTK
ncbi:MAG TPA: hypothetical protein VGN12_08105 [Pirellulales bacterium]|jgi:hypothetical protein